MCEFSPDTLESMLSALAPSTSSSSSSSSPSQTTFDLIRAMWLGEGRKGDAVSGNTKPGLDIWLREQVRLASASGTDGGADSKVDVMRRVLSLMQ